MRGSFGASRNILFMSRSSSHDTLGKVALVTGITGQDGSYLAELLLAKGYIVHGIKRRSSSLNTDRIDHLYQDVHEPDKRFILHYGDVTDGTNIFRLVHKIQPDEMYHLAAQSHVHVSFETAEYTANADALGTLRLLEAIRLIGLEKKTRFYQAATSEMYGNSPQEPKDESTPFHPASPYAVAKLYAYWITINYREAYGLHTCNGILFNHESPRRGKTFVSKKITNAAAKISRGLQDCLYIGNLDAERDWGHAKDYVYGMWLIMQHPEPDDFVLATGRKETVRHFAEKAFELVGIEIEWQGEAEREVGVDTRTGKTVIKVDKSYSRPSEVHALVGDYTKVNKKLGWEPKVNLEELIEEMVKDDLAVIDRDAAQPQHELKRRAAPA